MEQTPSTFELRLPASLLGVCCDVLEDESGNTRRLHALMMTGEDVDIAVRCEKKEWIQLFFQGAVGSIIDVVNDQWRCSIESISILPEPILGTHIAENRSAAKHQPGISGHHPATTVGENSCQIPAATETLVHDALVHRETVVHDAPVHQQPENRVTVVLSNKIKTENELSLRKSLRVQERRQRLSTRGCRASEIAASDTYKIEDTQEDGETTAGDKTGPRRTSPKTGRHAKYSKDSEKQKKRQTASGRVLTCDVTNESVTEEAGLSSMESDQSDAIADDVASQDTSPVDDTGDNQLQMECVTDIDHTDDDPDEIAGTARKKRRTLTDPNVRPYLCPECHRPFIVAISLTRHISAAHGDLPNFDAIVNAADDLRSSRLKAASAICVTCPVCKRNMRGTRVFTHMRKFHADDCDFDSLVALAKKQYYAERERVYQLNNWGRERVSCPHCGQTRARRRMSHHIRYQCKENAARHKFLRCRHCGYGTHRADRLEQHMLLHQDGTNFICDHCGKRYVSQAGLTVHLRHKHQESKRNPILSHPCPVCRKTFIHESRLKRHMTIHAEDRCHVCDACGKTFKDRGTMIAHRRTQHLGQYRYRCDRCGHGVEKRSYLHTHRCNVDTSNAALEIPAPDGRSVVVVTMRSDGETKVDEVMFSAVVVDDTGTPSQELT